MAAAGGSLLRESLLDVHVSIAAAYYKYLVVLWIGCGHFFTDFFDAGKARAAFKHGAQFAKLLRCAHHEDFHATIAEVFYVAANLYFGCGALCEVAIPNALDGTGDQILSGLFWLDHEQKIVTDRRRMPKSGVL